MSKWKIAGLSLAGLVLAGWAFVNSPYDGSNVLFHCAEPELCEDQRHAGRTTPTPTIGQHDRTSRTRLTCNPTVFLPKPAQTSRFFRIPPPTCAATIGTSRWITRLPIKTPTIQSCAIRPASSIAAVMFMPRATGKPLFAFSDTSEANNGQQALAHAYSDVAAAFEHFLQENPERPIVLAGHSQAATT